MTTMMRSKRVNFCDDHLITTKDSLQANKPRYIRPDVLRAKDNTDTLYPRRNATLVKGADRYFKSQNKAFNKESSQINEPKYSRSELRPMHDTIQICTERDEALRKATKFEKKIRNLETQLQNSRTNRTGLEKDTENEILRNENKGLRNAVTSLSKQLDSATMAVASGTKSNSASDKLVSEVKVLKKYRHRADNKIEGLVDQESNYLKRIDELNKLLQDLNKSYTDVTAALIAKSKDYYMLKAVLAETKTSSSRNTHVNH